MSNPPSTSEPSMAELREQVPLVRQRILDRLAAGQAGDQVMVDRLSSEEGFDGRAIRTAVWDLLSEGILGLDHGTGHFGLVNVGA